MRSSIKSHERLTIYLGGTQRYDLLEWTRNFTHAKSDSEAIFSALELLKEQVEKKRKEQRMRLADKTKGIWAGNKEVGKAFKEMKHGWTAWDKRLSS